MSSRSEGMAATEVPGMAEAIEARRLELGLTPGDLAESAGLTREGLRRVRAGSRRNYNDRTIFGVASALGWERDWYERLQRGEAPVLNRAAPEANEVSRLRAEVAELRRIVEDLQRGTHGGDA